MNFPVAIKANNQLAIKQTYYTGLSWVLLILPFNVIFEMTSKPYKYIYGILHNKHQIIYLYLFMSSRTKG